MALEGKQSMILFSFQFIDAMVHKRSRTVKQVQGR